MTPWVCFARFIKQLQEAKNEFEKQKKKEIVDLQQAYSKDAARQIEDLYKQIEVSFSAICHRKDTPFFLYLVFQNHIKAIIP